MSLKTQERCEAGHSTLREGCKSCRSLKRSWDQRLIKSGFTDIEKDCRIIDHKTSLDLVYRRDFQTTFQLEARQSYYQWAREKAQLGEFKNHKDKLIWESYAEGLSSREIGKMVGLEFSWTARKISFIRDYLKDQVHMTVGSTTVTYAQV